MLTSVISVVARIAALGIAITVLVTSCLSGGESDYSELADPDDLPQDAEASMRMYSWNEWNIPFIEIYREDAPAVLFIHGAPGSKKSFFPYFERDTLRKSYHLISPDRPGYGDTIPKRALPLVRLQAESLGPLLEEMNPEARSVIVAHSFGGPIALQTAIDNPDRIGGVVLLAPSLFGDLEPIFWFNKPARWSFLQPFIPRSMRAANKEKWAHIDELSELEEGMKRYEGAVTLIHGTRDSLVPVENSIRAARLLELSDVRSIILDDVQHFIPWTQEDLIVEEIVLMIEKLNNAKTRTSISAKNRLSYLANMIVEEESR